MELFTVQHLIIAALTVALIYTNRGKIDLLLSHAGSGSGSAFAKVAEADAKLVELKATADVKKAEAFAVHGTLDEVHRILGTK